MPDNRYPKAKKLASREYSARLRKGESPFLPALDEKVPNLNALERIPLGIVSIPVSKIVGTVTRLRANSFAANFMPLLDEDSEFGVKWRQLCESVEAMGVCQPIVAYEYLNQYYVLEGNKRVSVSRYLGAGYIEGEVQRVMPRESDDPEVRLYREFLPFRQDSGINRLWFSRPGSVERLYSVLGKEQGVRWTADERSAFLSAYSLFRRMFKATGGDRYSLTTGDAFLTYLTIYGPELTSVADEELRSRIRALEQEFRKESGEKPFALIMAPNGDETNSTLLWSLLSPMKIKAAFLYNLPPENSGWNYWHEQGRLKMQEVLGDRVESCICVCPREEDTEESIRKLIHDGNQLIFTTTPSMLNACIRPSLEFPDVKILNCSLLASYHNVRSYYLRFYEIKFLMGMIAGAYAEDDRIGYIADYPIYGIPASINAFALGARMMNPRAKIILRWSSQEGFCPEDPFRGEDVHVISNRDVRSPGHEAMTRGLYRLRDGVPERLAAPYPDWSKIYLAVANSVLNGRWNSVQDGSKAMDYWWGISSGAIDLALHPAVERGVRRLVGILREEYRTVSFRTFAGPLYDREGKLRCREQDFLSPADILTMDWLSENVEGSIPTMDEIREESKTLVRLQGLNVIRKPNVDSFSWNEEVGEDTDA